MARAMAETSTTRSRDECLFTKKTKARIRALAGGLCSDPSCLRTTSDGVGGIGDACHIYSAGLDGPRGRGGLGPEELKQSSNGIWLCKTHHGIADFKEDPVPAKTLFDWKAVREASCSAALRNDDIAKLRPLLSDQDIDQLVWDQYRQRTPGAHFVLDDARVAKGCWELMARKLQASADRPSILSLPSPPPAFKVTPISIEVRALGSPAPALTVTRGVFGTRASNSELDEEELVSFPPDLGAGEVAALLETVQSWTVLTAELFGGSSPVVVHHVTYGLAPSRAGNVEWDAMVPVDAFAKFSTRTPVESRRPFVELVRHHSPVEWMFAASQEEGGWQADSRLKMSRYWTPGVLQPEDFRIAEAFEGLLMKLEAGAELVGLLSPRSGHIVDALRTDFHATPFPIRLDDMPEGSIRRGLWRVRRVMLLGRLSADGLPLHLTEECFDVRLTDDMLIEGTLRVRSRPGRASTPLLAFDGGRMVMTSSRTWVRITQERC